MYMFIYLCKTQIDVQPLVDVQSSNSCPISTSQTSVHQIYVLFQIPNWHPIITSMAVSHFLKLISLTYALTNKLAIDLRI